jgi:hypothetical protein
MTTFIKRFKVEAFVEVEVEAIDAAHAKYVYEHGGETAVRGPELGDVDYLLNREWEAIDDGKGWVEKS